MARKRVWEFLPGEARTVGVSMVSDLDTDASLTGETPTVTAWTKTAAGVYSAATGFTLGTPQVNTAALTDADGYSVPIGEGISVRITAPSTQGTYYIRIGSPTDDSDTIAREIELAVAGPPSS